MICNLNISSSVSHSVKDTRSNTCTHSLTGGYLSLTHSFGVNPKLTTTKFGLKNLETSLYRVVQNAFQSLEPFRGITSVTDGQTDGQTDRRTGDTSGHHARDVVPAPMVIRDAVCNSRDRSRSQSFKNAIYLSGSRLKPVCYITAKHRLILLAVYWGR